MLVDFIDLKKEDILIAGGKGANLDDGCKYKCPKRFCIDG